jgi:hypothetical protein
MYKICKFLSLWGGGIPRAAGNQSLKQTAGHDSFLGVHGSVAPPLLSLVVRRQTRRSLMKLGTLGPLSDRRFAGGLLFGLAMGLGLGHPLGAEGVLGVRSGALTIGCMFVMIGAVAWAQQGWSARPDESAPASDEQAAPAPGTLGEPK